MKQSGKILVTLEEIASYSGRSKTTVLKWGEDNNFPATKVDGRWEMGDGSRRRPYRQLATAED